ncbi:MAG: ABA4-like family protein [Roseiflexaceae bacterium]
MSLIFQLSNLYILPWWILMIAVPSWQGTKRMIASPWIIAPLAVLYTVLVAPTFIELLPALMNPQLDVLKQLFASSTGTTIAWIHIISFDLWVGRWVFLDSEERALNGWLRRLALISVLMAGPFGAVLYLGIRQIHMRQTSLP